MIEREELTQFFSVVTSDHSGHHNPVSRTFPDCVCLMRSETFSVEFSEILIQMRTVSDEYARIMEHPEGYPGESLPEKILSNQTVRKQLQGITSSREWLKYVSTALRSSNKRNMAMIGISEEEVKAFTDERALQEGEAESNAINEAYLRGEFSIPEIVLDTLGTFSSWQD